MSESAPTPTITRMSPVLGPVELAPMVHPERAQRYLSLVAEVAGRLLAAADPALMVDELFALIEDELRLDVFFNYRLDEGQLFLEAHGGLTPEQAEAGHRLALGQAVCGCAAQDRRPIHVTGVQHSSDPLVGFVKDVGLDAYACTPLMYGSQVLGTLGFGRRWAPRFDEDELHLLHTICHYVALAKHRIRSERDLRAALVRQEALLQELNHRVRNSLQIILGLVALDAAAAAPAERLALQDTAQRIAVVAAVHQHLYDSAELGRIEIGHLLSALVADSARDLPAVERRAGFRLWLPVEAAVALALAVMEILRHPGEGQAGRPVELSLAPEDGRLLVRLPVPVSALDPTRVPRVVAALLRQLRIEQRDEDGQLVLAVPVQAVEPVA